MATGGLLGTGVGVGVGVGVGLGVVVGVGNGAGEAEGDAVGVADGEAEGVGEGWVCCPACIKALYKLILFPDTVFPAKAGNESPELRIIFLTPASDKLGLKL